jgi:hypothetical protein
VAEVNITVDVKSVVAWLRNMANKKAKYKEVK